MRLRSDRESARITERKQIRALAVPVRMRRKKKRRRPVTSASSGAEGGPRVTSPSSECDDTRMVLSVEDEPSSVHCVAEGRGTVRSELNSAEPGRCAAAGCDAAQLALSFSRVECAAVGCEPSPLRRVGAESSRIRCTVRLAAQSELNPIASVSW